MPVSFAEMTSYFAKLSTVRGGCFCYLRKTAQMFRHDFFEILWGTPAHQKNVHHSCIQAGTPQADPARGDDVTRPAMLELLTPKC